MTWTEIWNVLNHPIPAGLGALAGGAFVWLNYRLKARGVRVAENKDKREAENHPLNQMKVVNESLSDDWTRKCEELRYQVKETDAERSRRIEAEQKLQELQNGNSDQVGNIVRLMQDHLKAHEPIVVQDQRLIGWLFESAVSVLRMHGGIVKFVVIRAADRLADVVSAGATDVGKEVDALFELIESEIADPTTNVRAKENLLALHRRFLICLNDVNSVRMAMATHDALNIDIAGSNLAVYWKLASYGKVGMLAELVQHSEDCMIARLETSAVGAKLANEYLGGRVNYGSPDTLSICLIAGGPKELAQAYGSIEAMAKAEATRQNSPKTERSGS